MKRLTQNDLDIINYIRDYRKENDISPSYKEILDNCNFKSVSSVYDSINKLEELDIIKTNKQNGKIIARSIRINETEQTKELINNLRNYYNN